MKKMFLGLLILSNFSTAHSANKSNLTVMIPPDPSEIAVMSAAAVRHFYEKTPLQKLLDKLEKTTHKNGLAVCDDIDTAIFMMSPAPPPNNDILRLKNIVFQRIQEAQKDLQDHYSPKNKIVSSVNPAKSVFDLWLQKKEKFTPYFKRLKIDELDNKKKSVK